ncbi:MAG: hypothetical protein F4Y00_07400 [Bacteroidetes bacterium SB0662_bin_6]|nr:hypothetical protein [Bacteroidetes bacterium SB0668_bin_1]MYE04778.1 hypothetical protein [Bacteroidetes bacterium SB0662_bin_6]
MALTFFGPVLPEGLQEDMSEGYRHDPVSAIAEAEATGETAAIFADIRRTMQLPLITSIWRTLAGVEGGLRAVWAAAKPLYESGQPDAALSRVLERVVLPAPEPLVPGQLDRAGVSAGDLPAIRALLNAYNRSNGLNLIALSSLVVTPAGPPANHPVPPSPSPWPILPPLLAQADMAADTWILLHDLNRFGATSDEPGLATLWRHLAHWPGLLAVIHSGLAPLQKDGTIRRSIRQLLAGAQAEGASLARLRPERIDMPEAARAMVTQYVRHPGLVVRMVAIGHGLAHWLRQADQQV